MVAARIDLHVGCLGHVATGTTGTFRRHWMPVMNLAVVLARRVLVARGAGLVALVLEPGGMRIVAVGAANPLVVHLALQERTVLIHFVENLPVGVIRGW